MSNDKNLQTRLLNTSFYVYVYNILTSILNMRHYMIQERIPIPSIWQLQRALRRVAWYQKYKNLRFSQYVGGKVPTFSSRLVLQQNACTSSENSRTIRPLLRSRWKRVFILFAITDVPNEVVNGVSWENNARATNCWTKTVFYYRGQLIEFDGTFTASWRIVPFVSTQ